MRVGSGGFFLYLKKISTDCILLVSTILFLLVFHYSYVNGISRAFALVFNTVSLLQATLSMSQLGQEMSVVCD